jgi:hypothetical protein
MPSFGAISELPISALPVVSSGASITGTGATSQAQTASGTAQLGHQGTGSTSQAQTAAGTGTVTPAGAAITGTGATSQAQTASGSGQLGHNATGATSQAQTSAGTGVVTTAGAITGTGTTSQAQTSSGAGVVTPNAGYVDTHDGYWTKQWLERHKKPKIEEVIEYVIEQPQEAVAEVRAAVERVYPQIDYREVKNNVKLQRFIANQLMKAIKDYQDDEDMMTFMMMT